MDKLMLRSFLIAAAAGLALGDDADAEEVPDVEDTVRRYVAAGDAQDVAALESLLHTEFRVVLSMGTSVSTMSRSDYVGMARAKKIGGVPRAVDVEWVRAAGRIAFAKVKLTSKAAAFDSVFTLVRDDGGRWRLISDGVHLTKRS